MILLLVLGDLPVIMAIITEVVELPLGIFFDNFLRQLSHQFTGPWCIFGDFNDILDASEKRGRTTRPSWLINGFCQAVLDSGLSDVPIEAYPFTWFKSLGTPRVVE